MKCEKCGSEKIFIHIHPENLLIGYYICVKCEDNPSDIKVRQNKNQIN